VLARFTSVVDFRENTDARSNTRREVTAAIITTCVKFTYLALARALWALKGDCLPIYRWVSGEKLDSKQLVLFSLLLSQIRQALEFNEGLGALFEALVKVTTQCHN
jgi:hypothetical protein